MTEESASRMSMTQLPVLPYTTLKNLSHCLNSVMMHLCDEKNSLTEASQNEQRGQTCSTTQIPSTLNNPTTLNTQESRLDFLQQIAELMADYFIESQTSLDHKESHHEQ